MRWLGLLPLFVAATGCVAGRDDVAHHDDALIGGELDTRHVAVGAFVTPDGTGWKSFCTATLIAPRVVVTAKHCTFDLPADAMFALGADARRPDRVIEIVRFEQALPERGGFMRLGSDVAGVVLKDAVADVPPIPVATRSLDTSDVGRPVTTVGYGAGGPNLRKAGDLKVLAVAGQPLAIRYTTVDRWLDAVAEHLDHDLGKFEIEHYELSYRRTLLSGYEAYLSDPAVQTCHGDSGGPILRATTTGYEVVAVVSGGPLPGTISSPSRCDGGNIVGIVTPSARELLRDLVTNP